MSNFLRSGRRLSCTKSARINPGFFLASLVFLVASCEEIIEYSVFDADVKSEKLNILNCGKLSCDGIPVTDTVKFAVFSDVHEYYDEMSAAIKSINQQPDLQFVICGGDITNSGMVREFQWYADIARKSKYPIFTAIGNHDHLANGLLIYERLFGDPNFSFAYGGYKFVVFNNTMLENYNKSPRYQWLRDELSDQSNINILISHIPPFAAEIDDLNRIVFNNITTAGNVKLCVHGHAHRFSDSVYNDIRTIVAGDISDNEYYMIKLVGDQSFVEIVQF